MMSVASANIPSSVSLTPVSSDRGTLSVLFSRHTQGTPSDPVAAIVYITNNIPIYTICTHKTTKSQKRWHQNTPCQLMVACVRDKYRVSIRLIFVNSSLKKSVTSRRQDCVYVWEHVSNEVPLWDACRLGKRWLSTLCDDDVSSSTDLTPDTGNWNPITELEGRGLCARLEDTGAQCGNVSDSRLAWRVCTYVPALVFPSFAQTCVRGIRDAEMAEPARQRADTRIRL